MLALQREQDLNISREQREQDKRFADDRLRDTVLVTYLNEIANLLKENNGTLTANPVIATIARAKTLTAIRQLDSSRNSYLIKFLYEANQLTNGAKPIDLSAAELNGINLNINENRHRNTHNLSLVDALLRNSSFSSLDLTNANFTGADLTNARFDNTKLNNADMTRSITVRAIFTGSELSNAIFFNASSRRTIFHQVVAINTSFSYAEMESAIFTGCICKNAHFRTAQLLGADFSRAQLNNANFTYAYLRRVNFTKARFDNTILHYARLQYADFSYTYLTNTVFEKAEVMQARFVATKLEEIDFTNLNMREVDFSGAGLILTVLSYAKLDKAIFNKTVIVLTNFSFASMTGALITNDQLLNASSLRGATLPNGTKINHDPNLLHDGYADCNHTSSINDWHIYPPGSIVVARKSNFSQDCFFINEKNDSSFMAQRVNLRKYERLIIFKRLALVLKARGGGKISSIRIDDHRNQTLAIGNFSQSKMKYII